jgi:hypothetical protein
MYDSVVGLTGYLFSAWFKYATRSPVPERVLLLMYNVGEPVFLVMDLVHPSE